MDAERFDALTRALAASADRGRVLRALAAGAAGPLLFRAKVGSASAQDGDCPDRTASDDCDFYSDDVCMATGGGDCADLYADPEHCGDSDSNCDVVVGDTCYDGYGCARAHCFRGYCRPTCPDPLVNCCSTGCCTDLQSDPDNCGACHSTCAEGQTCRSGSRIAPCTAASDCVTDDPCVSFSCVGGSCTYGEAECGQISPENTCCKNIETGNVTCCRGDQTCVNGHCVAGCTDDSDCPDHGCQMYGHCQSDHTCSYCQPDPCFDCKSDDQCADVFRGFDPTADFDGVCCHNRCVGICGENRVRDERCYCVDAPAANTDTGDTGSTTQTDTSGADTLDGTDDAAVDGGSTTDSDTTDASASDTISSPGDTSSTNGSDASSSPNLTLPNTGSGQAAAKGRRDRLAPIALIGAGASIVAGRLKRRGA